MPTPLPPLTIVRSTTHVEIEWMRLPDVEVDFKSTEEEASYSSKDCALAKLIEGAVSQVAIGLPTEQAVYTNYDWWPNRNRAVTVSRRAFSMALLEALAGLISDEYQDWRIRVRVVEELPNDDVEFGSMFLTSEKVVVEQSLYEHLKNAA